MSQRAAAGRVLVEAKLRGTVAATRLLTSIVARRMEHTTPWSSNDVLSEGGNEGLPTAAVHVLALTPSEGALLWDGVAVWFRHRVTMLFCDVERLAAVELPSSSPLFQEVSMCIASWMNTLEDDQRGPRGANAAQPRRGTPSSSRSRSPSSGEKEVQRSSSWSAQRASQWRYQCVAAAQFASRHWVPIDGTHPALEYVFETNLYGIGAALLLMGSTVQRRAISDDGELKKTAPHPSLRTVSGSLPSLYTRRLHRGGGGTNHFDASRESGAAAPSDVEYAAGGAEGSRTTGIGIGSGGPEDEAISPRPCLTVVSTPQHHHHLHMEDDEEAHRGAFADGTRVARLLKGFSQRAFDEEGHYVLQQQSPAHTPPPFPAQPPLPPEHATAPNTPYSQASVPHRHPRRHQQLEEGGPEVGQMHEDAPKTAMPQNLSNQLIRRDTPDDNSVHEPTLALDTSTASSSMVVPPPPVVAPLRRRVVPFDR